MRSRQMDDDDDEVPELHALRQRSTGQEMGSDPEAIEESEGEEEEGEEEEEGFLEGPLADVLFEDLQRLRSQGHGAPPGASSRAAHRPGKGESAKGEDKRRANKNRPMEVSSKKPVPRFREVIQAPKAVVRDPRFESLSGEFDESRFKRSYGFIYNEALPQEAERLKKSLKKRKKDGKDHEELKQRLAEVEGQLKEERRRRKKEEKEAQEKEEQKEGIKAGKRPYFLSKAKKKKQELVEKFKELKAQGKLEAFLAKKRQKNAAKEHTKIPLKRRSESAS